MTETLATVAKATVEGLAQPLEDRSSQLEKADSSHDRIANDDGIQARLSVTENRALCVL